MGGLEALLSNDPGRVVTQRISSQVRLDPEDG
jgi:hypothetical protein